MNGGQLFDMGETEVPAGLTAASKTNVPGALPEWVKRDLEARGLMDPNTGATRRARARTCDACRRPVMSGIDEDFGGQASYADPTPVSGIGEAMARIAGRATFELAHLGDRYELTRRTGPRIRGRPAGTPRIDILVGHKCGDVTRFESAPERIKPAAVIQSDQPPF